jgi:hypothetical protein
VSSVRTPSGSQQKKQKNKKQKNKMKKTKAPCLAVLRVLPSVAAAAVLLSASSASANLLDLVVPYPQAGLSFAGGTKNSVDGITSQTGSGVIYSTIDTLPAGTGVFDPFLTYQHKETEQGYNTSQGGSGQGFLDDKRVTQWTHDLHVGDLAVITRANGLQYYAFELDANETGAGNKNRLLSIDDIRIYTHKDDRAGLVQDDATKVDLLGNLVYAQNATLGVKDNYVLIDASNSEGGQTSGSGSSDMILYVPKSLFDAVQGHAASDYLYFYTINGAHDEADNTIDSEAGFEEWRAVVGVQAVPDSGNTVTLLGLSLLGFGILANGAKLRSKLS